MSEFRDYPTKMPPPYRPVPDWVIAREAARGEARGRAMAADLRAQGIDACGRCLTPRADGRCGWCDAQQEEESTK